MGLQLLPIHLKMLLGKDAIGKGNFSYEAFIMHNSAPIPGGALGMIIHVIN